MPERKNANDLTADGVHFGKWRTEVENDDLELISINFSEHRRLKAKFLSKQKRAEVEFVFSDVAAFRVLDEGGLIELWAQSAKTPRPASTTFMVRGHTWQYESVLVWVHGTNEPYFSYMIATDWDCVEVIAEEPPEIRVGEQAT